jgi:zinc/manganese transport system permease protein
VRWLVAPGFVSSGPVHTALTVGTVVAVVAGLVGVFVVVRGQGFAGHALTDVATAGGSGAFLAGWPTMAGFVGGTLLGAGAMEAIGVQRVRGRDLATGIVLGAATGCSALFLYLSSTSSTATGTTQQILFGSLFSVAPSLTWVVAGLGALVVAVVSVSVRPLLLSSISPELAVARGASTRVVGAVFMAALAVAVALAAVVLGSILATALLIGPPAAALRISRRLSGAIAASVAIAVGSTWLGVLLAYDSPTWSASHRALPVSFFIVAVVVAAYTAAALAGGRRRVRGR